MPLPFATNPVLKNLPVYQPGRPIEEVARELGMPADDIIKLASNENPLGPSRLGLAAMRKALNQVNLYPDGNAYYLKQKLAAKLELTPAHLILGNGSNEILVAELQYGYRENFNDGWTVDDFKVQFSFKYSFSYSLGGDS